MHCYVTIIRCNFDARTLIILSHFVHLNVILHCWYSEDIALACSIG